MLILVCPPVICLQVIVTHVNIATGKEILDKVLHFEQAKSK
jgi:hypothetical protein